MASVECAIRESRIAEQLGHSITTLIGVPGIHSRADVISAPWLLMFRVQPNPLCTIAIDCVAAIKRDGETNSASAFQSIESILACYGLSHRSSTRMNVASHRVTYFTEVEPATLNPSARSMTRVFKGICSRTST